MVVERTLSIIKPDATARKLVDTINAKLEEEGLYIIAQKYLRLSRERAEAFYKRHRGSSYFDKLCEYMSSGMVVVQVLEGKDAIKKNRDIMGDTKKPLPSTIRGMFRESEMRNSIHGSKNAEEADEEITFFKKDLGID